MHLLSTLQQVQFNISPDTNATKNGNQSSALWQLTGCHKTYPATYHLYDESRLWVVMMIAVMMYL